MWTATQKAWLQGCSSRLQRLEAQHGAWVRLVRLSVSLEGRLCRGGARWWGSGFLEQAGKSCLVGEAATPREAWLALILEDWAPPPRGRCPRAGPQPGLSSWPVTHPDCMSWNGDRQRRDNPVLSREVWTGTTFQRKRTRGCRSEEPQQAHLGAALGDPGGSYLPQYKIGRPVFLSSTKCSPKANSFSWVSIYYHLKCHSLHG